MSKFFEALMMDEDPPVSRPSREEVKNSLDTGPGNGANGFGAAVNDRPVDVKESPNKGYNGESNDLKRSKIVVQSYIAKDYQPANEQQVDPAMYVNDGVGRIIEGSGANKENIQRVQIESKPGIPPTAEQPVLPVGGQAVDASGYPVVDGNTMTPDQMKSAANAVTAAPATTPAAEATTPVAAGTAPVQPAAGQVSLSGAGRPSYFYNQAGQFSSGNQSLQGLKALGELDLKPNVSTFQKAIAGVQRYEQGGGTMHVDKSGNFVQGWTPEDYNKLIDWTKVEGIGRPIDVSKKEDRDEVQNWLGSRFGVGLKGMHIDDKFGPYHVAAILEAAGQGGGNTPTPGDGPPPPERPPDPNEPEPDPYKDRYEEYFRNGMNPLLAYIGDEPKAIDTSRLRAIMGAQALGDGLRSIADVVHGPNGAPITEHKNNVTDWSIGKIDEAVKQFGSDKKEHRKMKLDALMYAMNSARNQANADKQDWRQGVAQMYDRFDKKVDRQDKQYKDLVDMYKWNKDFKLNVDKFASELQQKGLDRKQATELAIMQHGFRLQEQGQLMAHQAKLQKEAIEAGKYADNGNGTGGTGKHSTVTFIHKKADGTEVSGEASVPENISDKVNLALQKEAQTNDRLRADLYKLKSGLEKQGVPASRINRVILENYISNYYQYDPNTKTWSPVGGNTGGVATGANQSIAEQVNGSTAAPAKPATGQKPKLL